MANHKIFINNEVEKPERVGSSISTEYTYQNSILTVYWRGQKVFAVPANYGDAFVVKCNGTRPKVSPLVLPQSNVDKAMWLCSFPKSTRAHSRAEYEKVLSFQREKYQWKWYNEYTRTGEGWAVTLCDRKESSGVYHIAMYIDCNATIDTIKEAIVGFYKIRGFFYYPDEFVHKVLVELGIGEIVDMSN